MSVVIPTYNYGNVLPRAIHSVFRQMYQRFEVLVVDDGSTDKTASVMASFNDARVHYLPLARHTNANVARNAGIRAAKGEYIALLDADDEWLPEHLERRVRKMTEWDCHGIHGRYLVDDGTGHFRVLGRDRQDGESVADYVLIGVPGATPSYFLRRSPLVGSMFDESLERHQDWDFFIRFAESFDFRFDPEPTVVVHWPGNQLRPYCNVTARIPFYEKHKAKFSPSAASAYLDTVMEDAVVYRAPLTTLAYHAAQRRNLSIPMGSRFDAFLVSHPRCYYYYRTHPLAAKLLNGARNVFHRAFAKNRPASYRSTRD